MKPLPAVKNPSENQGRATGKETEPLLRPFSAVLMQLTCGPVQSSQRLHRMQDPSLR